MKIINKIILQEIKPNIGRLVFVILLVFLGVGFEALTPLPFKILIDNVLGNEPLNPNSLLGRLLSFLTSQEVLGFFIVLVYAASSILSSLSDYFAGVGIKKVSKELVRSFAQKAFDNLEGLAVGHYQNKQIGDYIYRLSYDVSALGNMFEAGILPLVTNFFYLVLTIAIMFFISAKLALIALAMLPILAIGLRIFNTKIDSVANKSERSNSTLFSFIEEVLGQLKIIQAFNQEKKESKIFEQKEEVSLDNEINVYGFGLLLNLMIGLVIAMGYSVIIAYGIRSVIVGELSTGLLIVFIFYLDNLTNPLLSLLSAATTLKEDYIRVSRMIEFFTPKFRIHDTGEIKKIDNTSIDFEKVSLYGNGGGPILKNASFKIPAGKTTAIVGVSGSGKTTIASLILKFMNPDEGKIMIGETDIKKYSIKSLRETISYVPQEIVLFNDTIKNNIAFGRPDAPLDDIKKAAHLADAEKFIKDLPGGYDFGVGEAGSNLSGGQRQRLMLARAFLKSEAQIMVFDEPLSSLDIKTRGQVMSNIKEFGKNKTLIIISNLLEIIKQADHVVLVNEGEIIRSGTSSILREEIGLSNLILNS